MGKMISAVTRQEVVLRYSTFIFKTSKKASSLSLYIEFIRFRWTHMPNICVELHAGIDPR